LALLGMHQLFDAFGFSLEARLALSTKLRDAFAEEFEPDRALRDGLRERFRSERANIAALLSGAGEDSWLAPGYRALCARSQALAPLVAALRATEARGELTLPVDELLPSYLHLFVNRVIRSDPRAHEFVLYELLAAHYRSALGRARAEAG
jgi:thiopeptide-type bacteriocin biosynthesis protein